MNRRLALASTVVAVGLALVGLLVWHAAAGEAAQTSYAGDLRVTLTLDRTVPGLRQATISIADDGNAPVTADRVTVIASMVEMGHVLPPVAAAVDPSAPGRYRAGRLDLSMAGDWEFDVRLARGDRTDTARFSFVIA